MVEIELDQNEKTEYSGKNESVTVKTSQYDNIYKKVTYEIKYNETYESTIVLFWWYRSSFNVYFKLKNKTTFTYYASQHQYILQTIEAYYNKDHLDVPLVLWLKIKYDNQYFLYSKLKAQGSSTGFPDKGKIKSAQLDQTLKSEDDRVNRVKFLIGKDARYPNCNDEQSDINGKFKKICYNAKHNNRYENHYLTKDELFKHESGIEVSDAYFQSVDNQYFDSVCVYFTTQTPIKVLLVEFINEPKTVKKHFLRQDCYGYHWVEKTGIDKVDEGKLTTIQTESDSKLSYLINKTDPYNGVKVEKENHPSFDKYNHTPKSSEITTDDDNSQPKIALLLYNGNKILFQANESISEDKRLIGLENQKCLFVSVYYELSYGTNRRDPPLVIELLSKSDENRGTDRQANGSNKTYWLNRLDKEGLLWTQFNNQSENIDTQKKQQILTELKYSSNKSIVVQINEKAVYSMKIIFNYNNGLGDKTNPEIQVNVREQIISSSNYKFYEHDLNPSKDIKESQTIVSIRCYFKGHEVILQNVSGKTLKLNHHPGQEKTNSLTTYFNQGDDLPLMLKYENKFYRPKSLNDYFTWEVTEITSPVDTQNIKTKLDKINKEFNEIKLNLTTVDNYGKIETTSNENILDLKSRITVTTQPPTGKSFLLVKHATTNTGPVGKITFNGDELKVLTEPSDSGEPKSISAEINNDNYNTVCAYYHLSDSSHKTPLLLGIAKDGSENPDMFFERNDNTPDSKWKRVSGTSSLQSDSSRAEKINKLQYNLNYSIKIKLEKQARPSDNYSLKLIKNGTTESYEPSTDITGNITVSEDSSCSQGLNYKCFTHTINLGSISNSKIGGLRFYLGDKEIIISKSLTSLGNLVIYFNYIQVHVHVYFYSNDQGMDKVPLLFRYDGQYYGPSSRDKYFERWVQITVITSVQDSLTQKLNEINRNLNDVDISETKNGINYGIPKPLDPPKELEPSFYNKILVKCCKNDNYRKITHSTTNKFGIGSIIFHDKLISSIKVQPTDNQVSVYYHHDDTSFSKPLIISLGSQESPKRNLQNLTKKWYKRTDLGETSWTEDSKSDSPKSYYGTHLKDKLEELNSDLFITLEIEIENHKEYKKEVYINKFRRDGTDVKVNTLHTCGGFEIQGYKCYEHQIYEFYNQIKKFAENNSPLNFVIQVSIASKKIRLISKHKVAPLLTYGHDDASKNSSLFVYFSKNIEGDDDTVPLVFNYNSIFYGPSTKNAYFSTWINLNIETTIRGTGGPRPEDKVKENLERIYEMINLIDLSQTSSYGLKCCNDHSYYNKKGGFSTKRVNVTMYSSTNYTMYLHKTVNNTKIGTIKTSDVYNFNQHSGPLKNQTIDEVAVVFNGASIDKPILVMLNTSAKYGGISTTHGYYYHKSEIMRGDTPNIYDFYHIKHGCKIISKWMGQSEEECVKQETKVLGDTWTAIIAIPLKSTQNTEQTIDTTNCKGPVENEKDMIGKCDRDDGSEDSTDIGSESSIEDQHQVGRENSSMVNRRISSPGLRDSVGLDSSHSQTADGQEDRAKARLGADGLVGSGGVDSGAKAEQGSHGKQGPSGPAGEDGEAGPQGPPGPTGPSGDNGETGEQSDLADSTHEHTNLTSSASISTIGNTHTNGHGTQQLPGGGVNDGQNGGGASPDSPQTGANGKPNTPGSSSSSGAESLQADAGNSNGDIWKPIKDLYEKQPEIFYGSGGGVGGVGVMATVGAVVYKKCVVGGKRSIN